MNNGFVFGFLIIGVLFIVLYFVYRKNFKVLKVPSVCLITGGVKTGKSLLSVYLAIKDYKSRHRRWWWVTHVFGRKIEEPLFYTNVQISFRNIAHYDKHGVYFKKRKQHRLDSKIVQITLEHLQRQFRINYKSVVYIQESSLMADSMDWKNLDRNIELSLWNKLFAHEGRGSAMYYDTQSPLDNHYSMKRVSSTYYFIQKNVNFLLFHILWVRELINNENGVNAFNDDVETSMRKVLIPFWYHRKYNRYEFSYLTDDLPLLNNVQPYHYGVVSFNDLMTLHADKRVKEVKKDETKKEENKEAKK